MPQDPRQAASERILELIDLDLIRPNPRQPRQHFDEAGLDELAQSLKEKGVIQPVVVRPADGGRFELIVGERRWRAAQRAGLLQVPAIVRDIPDDRLLEIALIENIQREELNAMEEAEAYRELIQDVGLTQQEVAERVGKQRATIANLVRLLSLSEGVQTLVRNGFLSAGHAKALVPVEQPEQQSRLAQRIVKEGLSVRQAEQLVAAMEAARPKAKQKPAPRRDPNIVAAEENLRQALGTKVRIVQGSKGGRIELHFKTTDELGRVYDLVLDAAKKA